MLPDNAHDNDYEADLLKLLDRINRLRSAIEEYALGDYTDAARIGQQGFGEATASPVLLEQAFRSRIENSLQNRFNAYIDLVRENTGAMQGHDAVKGFVNDRDDTPDRHEILTNITIMLRTASADQTEFDDLATQMLKTRDSAAEAKLVEARTFDAFAPAMRTNINLAADKVLKHEGGSVAGLLRLADAHLGMAETNIGYVGIRQAFMKVGPNTQDALKIMHAAPSIDTAAEMQSRATIRHHRLRHYSQLPGVKTH